MADAAPFLFSFSSIYTTIWSDGSIGTRHFALFDSLFREEPCQIYFVLIALDNCQKWLGGDLQTRPLLRSALRSKARRGRSQLLAGSILARPEAIMRQRRTKTHLALQLSTTRRWDTLLVPSQLPCWTSQWWSALVSTPHVSATQPMHMQKCQLIRQSIIYPVRYGLGWCHSCLLDTRLLGMSFSWSGSSID